MLFFVVFLLMCKPAMVCIKLQGCVLCCAVLSYLVWDGRMRIPKLRLATGTSGIAGKSQVWRSWCVLGAGQQGL